MDDKVAAKPDHAAIATPRRSPSQQRSRERVERMLSAASALIAEQGSDAMRMGEVAERAGVSIGSLYQFFPDKRAIVWALAERYGADNGRIARIILSSTLLSFLTLSGAARLLLER